jgi:hypothetical protein
MPHITHSSRIVALSLAFLALFIAGCNRSAAPTESGSTLTGTGTMTSLGTGALLTVTWSTPEALPGDAVSYQINLHNTTGQPLQQVRVDVTFPQDKLAVTKTDGGIINDDRITWNIPTLAADRRTILGYTGVVSTVLRAGDAVRTVVSLHAANLPQPLTGMTEVKVRGAASGASSLGVVSSMASSSSSSWQSVVASSVPAVTQPFFGRTQSVSSASSMSSVATQGLSLSIHTALAEAQPGHVVKYTATVRNESFSSVRGAVLRASFLASQVQVTNAGNGTSGTGSIQWDVGSLNPLETRSVSFDLRLAQGLSQGDAVQVKVEAEAQSLPTQTASARVSVIEHLPETGNESKFFAPLEDTSQYLRPYVR